MFLAYKKYFIFFQDKLRKFYALALKSDLVLVKIGKCVKAVGRNFHGVSS